ncbi:hypothetical protein L914_12326, partial [Phytophthora nicotianae]
MPFQKKLEGIKWLHETCGESYTTKAMGCVASMGTLEILQWLHENRSEGCTTAAMDGAA